MHNLMEGEFFGGNTGFFQSKPSLYVYARGGQTCSKKEPLAKSRKHQRAAKSVYTR